jgi:4-carboxymuconolactone decarboxylase
MSDPEQTRRFGPWEPTTLSSEQQSVVDTILAGPRGSMVRTGTGSIGLGGPFDALLHSPALCDVVQKLGEHVRFGNSLPCALNEMAIIMTARRWTAQYEWYAHRRLALEAGLDPSIADAIAVGARPVLDDEQTAVYEFTEQLLDRGDVTNEAFRAVADRWGKEGAIDLIGAVGYYTLVSFVLNVDRYPLPEGEAPLPPH